MMMPDDKKKIATIIVGKRKMNGDRIMNPMHMNPEVNLDRDFHYEGKHSAAEDVIAAHHERSPDRLMHALANFIDLHLHAKEGNKPEPYGSEV